MEALNIMLLMFVIGGVKTVKEEPMCTICICLPFYVICEDVSDVHFITSITLSTDYMVLIRVNFSSEYKANRLKQQFPFLDSLVAIDTMLNCEFVTCFYNDFVNITLVSSCYYDKTTTSTATTTAEATTKLTSSIDITTTEQSTMTSNIQTTMSNPSPQQSSSTQSISHPSITTSQMILSTLPANIKTITAEQNIFNWVISTISV